MGMALIPDLCSSPCSYSTHLPRQLHPQPPPLPPQRRARPGSASCCRARRDPDSELAPAPEPVPAVEVEERRSLAVRMGELFLGLAALLVRGVGLGRSRGGGAAATEVEARDGVVWEQRPEDMDVERRRRELTSPGLSFSTAGLLFPYHLGTAQCLMDRGYITEKTPLAGSSAGAIICDRIWEHNARSSAGDQSSS